MNLKIGPIMATVMVSISPQLAAVTLTGTLQAADGRAGDAFARSVSIHEDIVLVGGFNAPNDGSVNSGAAYVFTAGVDGVWRQQAKLTADDGQEADNFGVSVSVYGDIALIGARSAGNGLGVNTGAAYVFVRESDGGWRQQSKLTADDGQSDDNFGVSVSIDGDVVLVGADFADNENGEETGAAYVFVQQNDGSWRQQAKLTADDGLSADYFGGAVSLDGDTAVVGASYADNGEGVYAGAVYAFVRDTEGVWRQQAKLTASDGADSDYFGVSVSVDGDRVLVGADYADTQQGENAGAAYLYARDTAGVWTQRAKLTAADGKAADDFGWSVALEGDTALIGSDYADVDRGVNAGAAYLFDRSADGVWQQRAKLSMPEAPAFSYFGESVALFGETAVTGTWAAESAFVFALSVAPPPRCNGLEATIYVSNGVIVGGPMDGQSYGGVLTGTGGDDVMVGTDSDDEIFGYRGNDIICGLKGHDRLLGDQGSDVLYGGDGDDELSGGRHDDVLIGEKGNDTLKGETGNDLLTGDKGNDSLEGGNGNDVLLGGDGKDFIFGQAGKDFILGDADNDRLDGGPGKDTISGGWGSRDSCFGGEILVACELTD